MMEPAEALTMLDGAGTQPAPALPATGRIRVAKIDGLRLAVGATLGTRLIVWAAAIATIAIFGENGIARHLLDPYGIRPPIHSGVLNMLLSPAARWDSVWYVQIAAHGYFSPASTNFYPLYPLLAGLGSRLSDNTIVAGIAISIGATVAALTLLYRLAVLDVDRPAARMTVLLVAVFPASLFLSAVYPTSLFLLLTIAAVYAARRDRWPMAGLCGGLAAATSSDGILLIVVLALMYLYGPRGRPALRDRADAWWRPRFPIRPEMAWLALVPAGLAAYLGYLLVAHGDALVPFRAANQDWGHSFGPPLASIVKAIGRVPADLRAVLGRNTTPIGPGDPLSWQSRNLIDVAFLGLAVAGLAVAWSRVPRVYVIFAMVQLAEVTSFPTGTEPMIGLARYMLPMFALFVGAGAYLAERRTAARITLVTSAVLLAAFSGLWAYWSLVP
jgi:Mannosyltransferase (PIG-V)